MRSVEELAEVWRADAATLREYGDKRAADLVERLASQLEDAIDAAGDEVLTLTEASEVSGYSTRRLRELIASGDIPQAGRKHAPRIRRRDLPMKPGASRGGGAYDVHEDADALLGRV